VKQTHELKQTLERLDERIGFTPAEIAQILNVDRGLVYRLIAGKRIPALKIGSSCIIPRAWFDPLWGLEECEPEPGPGNALLLTQKESDFDSGYFDTQSFREGGI
jgi:excisionase family DNA binding protein